MKISYALIPGTHRRPIGVVVEVKSAVLNDSERASSLRRSLKSIWDFNGLPVVLASVHGKRIRYQGDQNLVSQLSRIDAAFLPWRQASIAS